MTKIRDALKFLLMVFDQEVSNKVEETPTLNRRRLHKKCLFFDFAAIYSLSFTFKLTLSLIIVGDPLFLQSFSFGLRNIFLTKIENIMKKEEIMWKALFCVEILIQPLMSL